MRVVDADALMDWFLGCISVQQPNSTMVREWLRTNTFTAPGPPERLTWTRMRDGTLRSSKIGEAWFVINSNSTLRLAWGSINFLELGLWFDRHIAIEIAEYYIAALGLGPAPPDPVAEIRARHAQREINKSSKTARDLDIEALLAVIDELRKEADNA